MICSEHFTEMKYRLRSFQLERLVFLFLLYCMGTDFIPQFDFLKSGRFFSFMLPITVKFLFFFLNESVVKKKALTTQGSTLFLLF